MQHRAACGEEIARALRHLHAGTLFLMTSAHQRARAGVLVRYVRRCADEPVLVSVAVRKGCRLESIVRDSHHFAVCVIDPTDRLVLKLFEEAASRKGEARRGDPFDTLPHAALATGSPIPARALAALDCEIVRHLDIEADHELYVGRVIAACVHAREGAPAEPAMA